MFESPTRKTLPEFHSRWQVGIPSLQARVVLTPLVYAENEMSAADIQIARPIHRYPRNTVWLKRDGRDGAVRRHFSHTRITRIGDWDRELGGRRRPSIAAEAWLAIARVDRNSAARRDPKIPA